MKNIYDNSTLDNDYIFSNDSYIYDCNENNNVDVDNNYRKNAFPMNDVEVQFRMDRYTIRQMNERMNGLRKGVFYR